MSGRLHKFAAVAAVALLVAGVVVAAVPVSNDIQDCGNPIAFLLDGRVNTAPADPAVDVTSCSVLSGRRAAAAVSLVLLAGLALLAWAAIADRSDRRTWEQHQQQTQQQQHAPTGGA